MAPDSQLTPQADRQRAQQGHGSELRAEHLRGARPLVIAWRRHLHSHPELSFHEHETARYITAQLTEMGLVPFSPTPTSVVADIHGARPGRTIAVRADIDALAVTEETGLPFASQTPGVMHACGHDGHTAALLGAAAVLTTTRMELAGRVRLIFQHAEELHPHGAPALIEAGVLDGVDAIIGQHLLSLMPLGVVGIAPGLMLASCDQFEITFTGRGGHGALPHQTRDPVAAATDMLHAMHRLIAREVDPRQTAVASVTRIHAGEAFNVIPPTATIGGTMRAFDASVRSELRDRITELANQVAAMHRMEAHVDFSSAGLPALVNDISVLKVIEGVVEDTGMADLQVVEPLPGSEDYACYLEHVPGAYVWVGAMPDGVSEPFTHHHPRFAINEDALAISTTLLAETAARLADPLTPMGDTGNPAA